ncbi:ethionine resistance protein [Coemansia spiralis]|uniref:Ethionine resistance protein n=2 Tax=Coemansia TaxID=4863 RepID=A0A9W8G9C1_9FUNG|nr:mate-domain-containing protein [Coemansia spiralis]KAJ1988862.1 ethionine resistance protein [Coemansia umbellata]KAJ2619963.1 ethionine resistance protein [Coemansia sp. RSA 1358]KAJ2678689.1 ethionine resistance protein [Coemansia spiralis]
MSKHINNEAQPLQGTIRPSLRQRTIQELNWLIKASTPLVGSYYLHYSFGFFNLISLGKWGGQALGAFALSNMTCTILAFAPAAGIASALDTLCSAAFVHSNSKRYVGLYLQRGLVAVSLWYVVVFFIIQLTMPSIYAFLGQPEELATPAVLYLRTISFGLWPWMAFECLKRYVQANTQMRLPALVLAGASLLHLFNHWFFVWHQPGEEVSFVAVAWITAISYWVMFLGLAACTLFCDSLRPAWHANGMKSLISTRFYSLAVPAIVEACGEYMAFELMTLLATYLGPTSLAAQAIAFNSMSMVYQLPHGVGGAAAVRIGQLLGMGNREGARFAASVLVVGGLAYSAIGTLFFTFYGSQWVATYTKDADVVAVASKLVVIAAFIEWTDATRGIVPGILRGLGKQRRAASINIASYYFVVLPFGIFSIYILNKGIVGLWVAFALGMSILSGAFIYTVATVNWDREIGLCAARISSRSLT